MLNYIGVLGVGKTGRSFSKFQPLKLTLQCTKAVSCLNDTRTDQITRTDQLDLLNQIHLRHESLSFVVESLSTVP